MKFKKQDIGILPLLLSLPFMFFPKVLEGDTQPWIFAAGLIAFFTFRTQNFFKRNDWTIIILSILCILVYAARSADGYYVLRNTYTYLSFIIIWVVCGRSNGDYFPSAVKATIVIWFIAGLFQYISIHMGYKIDEFPGRYLAGRMGPPSLTAEASYYGSISMLQLMYLLTERWRENRIFIALATMSVFLSGSLLSMLLLIFPLMKLPLKLRVTISILLPLLVIGDYYFNGTGVVSRLAHIFSDGISLRGVFHDASLNLRAGNIFFTMYENIVQSILLISPVDFMNQYNNFAEKSGVFIGVGSNYILPAIGEMIYGSGVFAVLLLVTFLNKAQKSCTTNGAKIEKVIFIIACMLNPISLSNIFLILYAKKKCINNL